MGKKKPHPGQVIKSRGEFTAHGITIKEWQRTPKQLLSEYCQSQKRPRPLYKKAACRTENRFRMRVVLPDPKGVAEKDIVLVTAEDYESQAEAEHATALLALQKVDGDRQHERKLPEPYATAWVQLRDGIGGKQTDDSAAKKGKKEKKEEEEFPCEWCDKKFKKEHGLAIHLKREHASQIAAKEAEEQAAEALAGAMAGDNPKTDGNIDERSTANDEEDSLFNFGRDDKSKPQKPTVRKESGFTISAQNKFATQHERRLANEAKQEVFRANRRKHEQFENSNPFATVFMSEEHRAFVEGVIRAYSDRPTGASDTVGDEIDSPHFVSLISQGFRRQDCIDAISHCGKDAAYDELLDWICIYGPEEYLPKGFDPRGKQLEVYVSKTMPMLQSCISLLGEAVDIETSAMKGPAHDLLHVYEKFVQNHIGTSWFDLEEETSSSTEEGSRLHEDELTMLEVTFEPGEFEFERGAIHTSDGHTLDRHKVKLGEIDSVPGESVLELYTVSASSSINVYPFQSAVVLFWNSKLNRHINAEMNRELSQHALNARTVPHVYELWDHARSVLPDIVSKQPRFPFPTKQAWAIGAVSASDIFAASGKTRNAQPQKGRSGHSKRSKHVDNSDELVQEYYRKKETDQSFRKMLENRAKLPAYSQRQEVIKEIQENQVVLLSGETGCGKTTQVPQFILEDFISKGKGGQVNIICTQPRRLAAIGVAQRVVDERCESTMGGTVGFQIRLENKTSDLTRLSFVTTGILLRRLQTDQTLEGVTHILVDEVHERNVDTDFLLSILKSLLPKRKDLKLVLMSATMDAGIFCEYFGTKSVVKIPGFVHPVQDIYLDKITETLNFPLPRGKDDGEDEEKTTLAGLARLENNFDFKLVAELVDHIHRGNTDTDGCILVFMSGAAEIGKAIINIQKRCSSGLLVLPLHGGLSGKDQSKVFQRPPKGIRKVVVSTNVAETSVTIDDVVYVIDSGRHKETQYDPVNRMSMLVETWVSRNSARQRRGRAGRVRPGVCYKLYTQFRHDKKLDQAQLPEIHRVPLEQLILQVLASNLGQPLPFMNTLIEPPPSVAVLEAVRLLTDVGAAKEDRMVTITPLGSHLSRLPMDIRIGKMLIYGSLLLCADQVLTIAATLSVRNPFVSPLDKRDEANEAKKELLGGESVHLTQSDHLCLLYAFERWNACEGEKQKRSFAERYFLHHQSLNEARDLRRDFKRTLEEIGFDASSSALREGSTSVLSRESVSLVKAALCAGLYPNVINVRKPLQKFSETVGGAVAIAPEAQQLRMMVKVRTEADVESGFATAADHDPSSFLEHVKKAKLEHELDLKARPKRRHDLERVFIHPSSVNFHQREYQNPWLVFHEKVKTSKVFIRDSTVVPPYSLLMFGGDIDVQHEQGTVTIDGWITFRAQARIGVLIRELRKLLDRLLEKKIDDPSVDIAHTDVLQSIKKLIVSAGFVVADGRGMIGIDK